MARGRGFSDTEPNNVMLFGVSGAGKSTVCACLTLFICDVDGLVPYVDSVGNPRGARISRTWRSALRGGTFPPQTEKATFGEVVVGFKGAGEKEEVVLRFLEVAGEDVVKLDPAHVSHKERRGELNDWMDRADAFLLIASAEPSGDERYILEGFLDLLGEDDGRPLCLLISSWDLVRDSTADAVDYAKDHYGEATRIVADRKGELVPFSVGDVSVDGKEITRLDLDAGTRDLIRWLDTVFRW